MLSNPKFQHLLREAVAHHEGGRLTRAEALYRQLLVAAPRHTALHDLLGQLALQQGRDAEGLRHLTQACRLDDRSVPQAVRLAAALLERQRPAEAEQLLRGLTARLPRNAEAWNALAYTLKVSGRLVEALGCHRQAVELDPRFVEGWYHQGLTLASLGHSQRALHCHERALALNPRHLAARFGRAQALHKTYRLREALADYDLVLRADPRHHEARSYRLFALQNSDEIPAERLFAEHCEYGRLVGSGPAWVPGRDPRPDRRLRLAILSPDLRTHSCAYFLEPLLRHLPADEFELYLYHDHFIEDEVSARLRALAAVWRNFIGQPHPAVERVIRADQPDVLIDLTGHVGNTIRLPLFARRLAPVQITYLGYPDTTGVPAMDYRFTDAIADPRGTADAFATERLVRFAPTAWTYQPPLDAPPVTAPPAGQGSPVIFGCFSSPTKFTDSLFSAWAEILRQIPAARLRLKGGDFDEPEVRAEMLRRLAGRDVPLDRVELLPRTATTAEHLRAYGGIDIALDTFPYTGTTTTCEALWMGRPVVTCGGDRHAARVGASLLTAVGHPEWIGQSVAEYVAIAIRLAADPVRLTGVAGQLRDDLRRSPLLDHAGQAACFARAVRDCWRERAARFGGPR